MENRLTAKLSLNAGAGRIPRMEELDTWKGKAMSTKNRLKEVTTYWIR
jgi:hypothetical protein